MTFLAVDGEQVVFPLNGVRALSDLHLDAWQEFVQDLRIVLGDEVGGIVLEVLQLECLHDIVGGLFVVLEFVLGFCHIGIDEAALCQRVGVLIGIKRLLVTLLQKMQLCNEQMTLHHARAHLNDLLEVRHGLVVLAVEHIDDATCFPPLVVGRFGLNGLVEVVNSEGSVLELEVDLRQCGVTPCAVVLVGFG